MDLQSIALGLGGIFVSVLTFAIGYRQTIGAKQIRIAASNDALVETFLRVVVVEQLEVSGDDVETAINGTAAKIGVPSESLRSGVQLAEVVHHQILASDLISKTDRERALSAVASLKKELAPHPLATLGNQHKRQRRMLFTVLALAVTTSLLGVGVVLFLRPFDSSNSPELWVQFGVALLMALVASVLLTFRYGRTPISASTRVTHPAVRDFLSYPEEVEGRPYLKILQDLSPFAVRNLFQLGQDEMRSMQFNAEPGLRGDPAFNLGLQELIDNHLAVVVAKPRGRKSREDWYGLTAKGRGVVRLLLPSVENEQDQPVPDYLLRFAAPGRKRHDSAPTIKEAEPASLKEAPVEADESLRPATTTH